MIAAFRRFSQTTVVKYGLVLLALSFITWGIGDYLNGGNSSTAVTVGKSDISVNELYQSYQQRKRQFGQMTGETITDEIAAQMGIPSLVLSEAVRDTFLKNSAITLGLTGSDREVAKAIKSMNAFQQDGAFNAEIYRQQLSLSGLSARSYEADMKNTQRDLALRALFRPSTPRAWAENQAKLNNSTYTLTVWPIRATNLPKLSAPSEKELNEFYTARAAQYQTPEVRAVNRITLSQKDFMPKTAPTQGEIEAYYNDNPKTFTTPEKRKVMQATFLSEEEANAAREKLLAGDTLPNAVSLGTVTQDDLPAAFASEVFKLEKDTFTQPLETPLGQAIAWVTEIQPSALKPLAEVKSQITTLIQEEAAMDALEDALADIDDAAAGGTPLAQIASEFGLTVSSFPEVTLASNALTSEERALAFELMENEISESIEAEDGTLTFVEVARITPPTLPALNMRLDLVLADYTSARNQERIQNVLNTAKNSDDIKKALTQSNVTTKPVTLTKQSLADIQKLGWQTSAVNALKMLEEGKALPQNVSYNDALSLVELKTRTLGQATPEATEAAQSELNNAIRDDLFTAFLQYQESTQKIKMHEGRLRQVFGQENQ